MTMKHKKIRGKDMKRKPLEEITETPLVPLNPVTRSAAFLGVSVSLLWKEIKAGRIPVVRIGDRVFVRKTFLEQLVNGEVELGNETEDKKRRADSDFSSARNSRL
jgi:hypothetical protein